MEPTHIELKLFINGEWVDNKSGETIKVKNPATMEIIGSVPVAGSDEINEAVECADAAFKSWKTRSPEARADILAKASVIVRERADDIARMMTMEQGKPFNEARGEVTKGADILLFYAEEAKRLHGELIPGYDPTTTSYTVYEPVGVAAAISPWNYPIELIAWKIGGAVGSGCTLVMKPPSETPLSPAMFIECIADAGLPAGVLNIIFGRGSKVGPMLIGHEKVRKVAFTGSTAAGREVAELCGKTMKKVSLELGGQCPLIITKKANLEAAVKAAVRRSFRNMGQICIAINRIYVEKPIYDEFMQKFREGASKLIIANGIENPAADLGAMLSESGIKKVKEHVEDAVEKGAELFYGGKAPDGAEYENGYFYMPTILAGTNHEMKVMTEETFGPVVGVMPFDGVDEAIKLANDSNYGLASYVYTDDLHEADRFSRELESGNVAINNPDAGVINAPYGGFKDSGMGYEHAKAGMMEYLRTKHIRIKYFGREG